MKRFTLLLVSILAMVCMGLFFGCGEDEIKPDPKPQTYNVTVIGGTADKQTAEEGETITLTLGTVPDGKEFVAWKVDGEQITANTFTMPAKDVTAEATYKDAPVEVKQSYTVTVTGGTADKESAYEGDTVALKADQAEEGYEFSHWLVNEQVVEGRTFVMGAQNTTVEAVFKKTDYKVTVYYGTADVQTAQMGDTVTLTPEEAEEGYVFSHWVVNGERIEGNSFVMTAKNATASAYFGKIDYTVTVTGGTADKQTAQLADVVTLTPGAADAGYEFSHWTVNGEAIEGNSFTMGAANVTVAAVCVKKDLTVTVTYGTADKQTAQIGDTVTLTFTAEAETGYEFSHWTVNGEAIEGNSFTMGGVNATVAAVYKLKIYTVTVTGGTADKQTATMGETVKLTPGENENENETFGYWLINGKRVTENSFVMTAEDTTVVAVFAKVYTITVTGGTADYTVALEGETVMLTPGTAEAGYEFSHWTVNGEVIEGNSFTMGAANATVAAVCVKKDLTVTVTGGSADKQTAQIEDTVTLTVGEVPEGERFMGWTVNGEKIDGNTFTMGAVNAVVEAVYANLYTITVTDGSADKQTAIAGETVTLTPDANTEEKTFVYWTVGGERIEGNTFEMKGEAATAVAVFILHNQKIATPDNTDSKLIYKEQNVTAIAFDRSGTTMFGDATDHVILWIYNDAEATEPVGHLLFTLLESGKGQLTNSEGQEPLEVQGKVGNFYVDVNGNGYNKFHNLIKSELGYKYGEGIRYYFAAQIIAKTEKVIVEGVEVQFTDSAISAIGQTPIVKNTNKPSELLTIAVVGEGALIDGEFTTLVLGAGNKVTLSTPQKEGYLFSGWFVLDENGERSEQPMKVDLSFEFTVDESVRLEAVYVAETEVEKIALATPDNSESKLIQKASNGAIEFDRRKGEDGTTKLTMFTAETAYVKYYIYNSATVEDKVNDSLGQFRLRVKFNEEAAGGTAFTGWIETVDGSDSREFVRGKLGDYYIDGSNASEFYGLLKKVLGYKYSEGQIYYYAVQAIAAEGTIYKDSEISEIGTVGFAQDANKPAGLFTVKVLGDTAKIDGALTQVEAGYGVSLTLTAEMPEGMDKFLGWKTVTYGDSEEEILGSAVSLMLTYNLKVTGDITLRAVFADSSEITAEKLAAPDNSNNQMFKVSGVVIEFDRQKNADGSEKTAFGVGVDHIVYYIYDSNEEGAQPVASFKLMRNGPELADGGYLLADDGTKRELKSRLGNLYWDDGNVHNFVKKVYKDATGKDWSSGSHYIACQAIADDSGLYENSDIGAKGQAWAAI